MDKLYWFYSMIALEFWRKDSEKDEIRIETLNLLISQNVAKERWEIVQSMTTFLKKEKDLLKDHEIVATLNHWLAIKKIKGLEAIKTQVDKADFSAYVPLYQLALLSLKSDKEKFFQLLVKTVESGQRDILTIIFKEPIFEEMRECEEFEQYLSKKS